MRVYKSMLDFLLNLLYPKKCMFCGAHLSKEEKYYCNECYYRLPILEEPQCLICGRELFSEFGYKICTTCQKHKNYLDVNYPVFRYEGVIKEAVRKHKFAGKMWYYKPFSDFIYGKIHDKLHNIDYIVYPPVNEKTFYKRGFNQCELIAKELSDRLNIKYLKKCILKKRDNLIQSSLSADARAENVKNAFMINVKYAESLNKKRVLLIDDVLTTGATINECAKVLKKAGVTVVYSATLCITK